MGKLEEVRKSLALLYFALWFGALHLRLAREAQREALRLAKEASRG